MNRSYQQVAWPSVGRWGGRRYGLATTGSSSASGPRDLATPEASRGLAADEERAEDVRSRYAAAGLMKALPLYDWMQIRVTDLLPQPNDPWDP
jgi:hypothetical protein